jgi:hypothetical protein
MSVDPNGPTVVHFGDIKHKVQELLSELLQAEASPPASKPAD